MLKRLIAGIVALSLAVTVIGPAQAEGLDRDDVGKIIIGIAAVAALNALLESRDRDRDRDDRAASSRNAHSWADLNRPRARQEARYRDLPSDCLRRISTRSGVQHIYTQTCLDRRYAQADQLPNRCRVRLQTRDGARRGYDPLCLREQGYRSDRRR